LGIFQIHPTKTIDGLTVDDCVGTSNGTPLVVNSAVNNGVAGFCELPPTEKGNIITFSDTTGSNTFFYHKSPFIGFSHVQGMYPINFIMNERRALFLVSVLMFANKGLYSYGRKMRRDTVAKSSILLPSTSNGDPDWQYMEDFVEHLHSKRVSTTVQSKHIPLNITKWGNFRIGDLFDVKYGVNLELDDLEICDPSDKEAIAFVSRTESNNGVSAYVKYLPDIKPQPAHILTVAAGGSVLSTFLQNEPFYSGRDLYLLINNSISDECRLFIKTVIEQNKFRFNYGRQANKHLNDLLLKLPVTPNGDPDWQWMEDYIKSLPYSDRISIE